jgi:hypothetical protein
LLNIYFAFGKINLNKYIAEITINTIGQFGLSVVEFDKKPN